jgi:hypothetical protein
MSDLNVQVAREHVKTGERWLDQACAYSSVSVQRGAMEAAIATAHFSAAMAITNILLADPAEAPEPRLP